MVWDMDVVEQVKATVDIVSVVREYVPRLQKRGSRWIGLCPFHSEKTPSFGVHEVHQFYKCFGCGAGGDVFRFVMEMEGLTFYEALKLLAERNGIPMPKRSGLSDPESKLRGSLYDLHELAGTHFRKALRSDVGKVARRYLEKRGVSQDVADEFGLGFAEPGGNALFRRLQREGTGEEQLRESGLVSARSDGSGWFDRFRNRLIFPIHNESGRIIAFAGRALQADDEPKYLNSPETKIYRKKFVLYNLHRAKKEIRKLDRAVLVEGYMDVIGLHAAGVDEAVASCGTALAAEQVRALRRHSERIVVNFDADAAGTDAAERSIRLLLEEGVHVRVLELADGMDPDEFVRSRGADAYRERLENATGYFHWLADRARKRSDMRTAEGRMEVLKSLQPAIQLISDKLERAAVASDIAAYLGVDAGLVLDQFRRSATRRGATTAAMTGESVPPLEQMLVTCLLANRDARAKVLPQLEHMELVSRLRASGIYQAMVQLAANGPNWGYSDVEARLNENDKRLLASVILADQTHEQEVSLEQALECLRALREAEQRTKLAELKQRVKEAERDGNLAEALRLNEELYHAERELR